MNTQSLSRICASAVALIGLSTGAFAQEQSLAAVDTMVPDWVKSAAKLYANGHTSHDDFMGVMTVALNATTGDAAPMVQPTDNVPMIIVPNSDAEHHQTGTFLPRNMEIESGTTVHWLNQDNRMHAIQSKNSDGTFNTEFSGYIDTGHGFTHTFDEPGLYRYGCAIHPWRQGAVIVR